MLRIFSVFAIFGLALFAQARTADEVVTSILDNNIRLKQLAAQNQADVQAITNEASDFEPTEFEYEHLFASGSSKWNIGVSQSFRWPSTYRALRSQARNQSVALAFLYDAERLSIARQAYDAIASLDYTNKKIALLDSVDNNLAALQQYVTQGYEGGQLTILDVKKIALERYRIKSQLSDLRDDAQTYAAELTALGGSDISDISDIQMTAPLLLPLDTYVDYALQYSPEILANQYLAKAAVDNARSQRSLPGFSLGYRHAYEENTHFNGFTLGVTLPVFSRKKSMEVARQQALALTYAGDDARARTVSQITSKHTIATTRLKQLKDLSDFTLVENYPALMLMAYKGGQINVITYIQELNYFLDARNDLLDAAHRYNLAVLALLPYTPSR